MATKRQYRVQYANGDSTTVEATSFKNAIVRAAAFGGAVPITSVSLPLNSATGQIAVTSTSYVFTMPAPNFEPITISAPTLQELNPVLERLGYKAVRMTSNLLNPGGKRFAIDADTPVYLDPGSEAYHSA